MKESLKKKHKMKTSIQTLILLYASIVIALFIGTTLIGFLITLAVAMLLVLLYLRFRRGKDLSITALPLNSYTIKQKRIFSGACFAIILSGSLLYWLAYYPGGFNLDAYGQWEQAHGTMPYSDWHPVLSTLIIKACISIDDSFSFCIASQIVLFSLSCTLLLRTLLSYGVKQSILVAIAAFIGINPAVGLNTVSMIKDVHFTILVLLYANEIIKIYFSDGTYLSYKAHWLVIALIGASICLVRHNGILYVAPAFIILAIHYVRQRIKICAASIITICIMIIIKGPLYKAMEVSHHENLTGEAVGIPMAIMVNALVNDPDNLPDDVHDFLNTIASDEQWKDLYIVGEWDSCKWDLGGTELLKDTSLKQIANMTFKTIAACPNAAYESFRANTCIVWQPLGAEIEWMYEPYIEENDWEICPEPNEFLYKIVQTIEKISFVFPLSAILWNTGFHVAAVLGVSFISVHKKMFSGCIVLPMIVFDVGTMLLLCGPNQRYFYFNAALFLPGVLAVLYKHELVA